MKHGLKCALKGVSVDVSAIPQKPFRGVYKTVVMLIRPTSKQKFILENYRLAAVYVVTVNNKKNYKE